MKAKVIKAKVVGFLALALLTGSMSAGAAVIISNNPTGRSISAFGWPDTQTYGQVFTAPISGTLDSFTLWLNGGVGELFGGVGTWNGTLAHGLGFGSPINLYESAVVTSSGGGAYTFTPNISVTAGQLYVAYLSVFGVSGAYTVTTMPLGDNTDPYINYFVWNNSSFDNSDPRNNPSWNYFADFGEVQFSATFSPAPAVPEPGTIALMGFGLAGLASVRRHKFG